MTAASLFLGVVLAVLILVASFKSGSPAIKKTGGVLAMIMIVLGFVVGSIVFVRANEVGVVTNNAIGRRLPGSKIIATEGEMGIQARVLSPGWHIGYWPVLYAVKNVPLTEIKNDEIGIIESSDGLPLDEGQLFAPAWAKDEVQKMLQAEHFLSIGKGHKGKQTTVLTPGKYRLNPELFKVRMVKQTEVKPGEVAVLTANFGTTPTQVVRGTAGALEPGADGSKVPEQQLLKLAKVGEMGILADPLPPGKYPINTDAFAVTEIWTTQMIAHYTAANAGNPVSSFPTDTSKKSSPERTGMGHEPAGDEREIKVTTSDGFQFPVDVRIEYYIEPRNAPIVVAKLGDDEGDRFRNALNSAVRAIFRNSAENVKALDYVQQRSHQESQSLTALKEQMGRFGVSISAVRIGNVGDQATLGKLLDTQTQREIAKQEQMTTQEQQRAAEQKKLLAKATQESEEEKKLATATYAVKIATETQKQKITEAEGEAQATQIRAKAQSEAFKQIAEQIGKSNAALMELMKIVGERNIQITPRVLITGGSGAPRDPNTAALIGTLLDQMIAKDEDKPPTPPAAGTPQK